MGVVGSEDAGAVFEGLLEQGDGLVEAASGPVGAGEVWTAGCFSDSACFLASGCLLQVQELAFGLVGSAIP